MTLTPATRRTRPRRWPGVAAWVLWALTMLGIPVIAWLDQLSRQAGRPELAQLTGDSVVGPVLACLSAATVGAVLASRRPRHPVGWLLLALGLSLAWSGVPPAYAAYGLLVRPGALPAAHTVARCFSITVVTAQTAASFVLLLTPTGSLPSPRWRWWARVTAAAAAILVVALAVATGPLDPRYQPLGGPFDHRGQSGVLLVVNQLALAVTTLAVVVGAASLVVRFRRAHGVERQQLRWVAWAAALAVLGAAVALAGLAVGATALVTWALSISFAVLPLAIGAAILRYRLYDLDHILSRTLAYGLLTVLLAGGYAAVVLGLGQLLGRDSSLAVAAATLAAAAVVRPARRRIQQAVDRRFTDAATMPPRRSRRSATACASRSTWTPWLPSCWRWPRRPCSRPSITVATAGTVQRARRCRGSRNAPPRAGDLNGGSAVWCWLVDCHTDCHDNRPRTRAHLVRCGRYAERMTVRDLS